MLILKDIFKYILLFSVIINTLSANDSEKLKILAKVIETKDNIITAKGNILVHSPQYYITAQKVIYDKEKSTLELFDNVNIIKDGQTTTFSDYAFLDFSKQIDSFAPILLMDTTNNIWINSKEANKTNNLLTFKNSTLSSCDCYDPAWSINFTSGDFNSSEKWINTYNTTLFIKDIPVLYTPYFGFPTDFTRRTGFLKSTIGYSNIEGLLYAQPFFYASKLNWDMEYIPQFRSNRGKGHQLTYRLKDSSTSSLEIEIGEFTEDTDYFNNSSLRNKKHYGLDLIYNKSKLISDDESQDELLVSLHGLNDIDYINTKYNNESTIEDKLIESKIEYFYNTNDLYGDINFKYYNDTSKLHNDDTMQELPKIHLHKYLTKTFIKDLLYSADVKFSNKVRTIGLEAQSTNVFFPMTYNVKLFDDYINLTFSEELSLIDIKYGNYLTNYKNGQFLENKHIISLSTDLLKPYKDYIHTTNFKMSLTLPNIIKQDGDLYSINNTDANLEAFPCNKN